MTKRAMLFPGQGAQYPGMCKDFCDAYPEANALFDRSNAVLGFDLKDICFNGSENDLNRTDICQPGILTASLAIMEVLKERYGLKSELFEATAGLSLGEYTALVFSGVLSFDDAVLLVAKRGQYMQEDSNQNPSGMISLIGADKAKAEELCRQVASHGVINAANFLHTKQVVISGSNEALDAAEKLLKEFGIKRGIRLKVAGAFHTSLMAQGGEKLKVELEKATFKQPKISFASNVTGGFIDDPDEIKSCLGKQVTSPVLWSDTMLRFIESEITDYFEPGPGKVLTSIVKKHDRSLNLFNLDVPQEIGSFSEGWKS